MIGPNLVGRALCRVFFRSWHEPACPGAGSLPLVQDQIGDDMPCLLPDVELDDEVLTAKDLAANLKQSVRYAQKLFELGEIPSFLRGRERVCMKSWYLAYLQRLIDQERQRQSQ